MQRDQLTCPKCGGEMPSRTRNGIVIEQCRDCHGIYLDAGEYERLTAAESSLLGPPDPTPEPEPEPRRERSRSLLFLA